MNPRVSRSSALASKATGFPIAKIAAKLALGYRLDEIPNDITRVTPASFEPTIDYIVVKIPRWNFEKFPQADRTLTTQMKSVGEAMAIGRTFKEAFLKGIRSLELGKDGLLFRRPEVSDEPTSSNEVERGRRGRRAAAQAGGPERPPDVGAVPRARQGLERRAAARADEDRSLVPRAVRRARRAAPDGRDDRPARHVAGSAAHAQARRLRRPRAGRHSRRRRSGGARAAARAEARRRLQADRHLRGGVRVVHAVPLQQLRRDAARPSRPTSAKVIILGSGPNRIGQGIEFDYCCCHAVFGFRKEGFETIMINCNPETVSTDYDTADRLYFEPLTFEDVMAIIEREREGNPDVACVVQFGGQTPLKLALALQEAGVTILGTSPDSIDLAEDRQRFAQLLWDLGIPQPASGTATSKAEAREVAAKVGFPVVVRPSYVLGGRAMAIVYDVGDARSLHGQRGRRVARSADPDRSLPGARQGDRRRLRRRRDRRGHHRRHHGAHRGGRHPLGRQLLRRAAGRAWPRSTSRRFATTRAASRAR